MTAAPPTLKAGSWRVRFPAGQVEALVVDQDTVRVATISGRNADEIMKRALLFAAAPELRACAITALMVFDAIGQSSQDAPARANSRDLQRRLVATLTAAGIDIR